MKRSRFSESQVVAILEEADAGMKVSEICRKHGISDATYCNWKSKYGGMEASDLKRVKEIEAELSPRSECTQLFLRASSAPTCRIAACESG